jgi:predicted ATPase
MQQKIVITGGPSTGKSTLIGELSKRKYTCLEEISREVILEARAQGIEHLFLTSPLLFSEILLEKRTSQYKEATNTNSEIVFFDRGIIDIIAYLNFSNTPYEIDFDVVLKDTKYQHVFICPPWKEIHKTDNERYESFEQALEIHEHLLFTYKEKGYDPIEIPFGTPKERCLFILKNSTN